MLRINPFKKSSLVNQNSQSCADSIGSLHNHWQCILSLLQWTRWNGTMYHVQIQSIVPPPDLYIVMRSALCNFCSEVINITCKGYWSLLNPLIHHKIFIWSWWKVWINLILTNKVCNSQTGRVPSFNSKLVTAIPNDLMWLLDYLVWYHAKRMIIVRNDNLYLKNDNHLECNLNMHGHVTDIYLTKVHKAGLAKRHNQKADATDC